MRQGERREGDRERETEEGKEKGGRLTEAGD